MAENCENSCGNYNVGLSQCAYKIPAIGAFLFVRKYDSDGVLNGIDTTVPFTPSLLTAALNEPDSSKRFYPIGKPNGLPVNGITPTGTEPANVTLDSGTVVDLVPRGVVNWEFTAFYTNNAWTERVRRLLSCGDWTVFYVDINNYPHGILSEDGDTLYGYDIESFRARFNWGTTSALTGSFIQFTESLSNDYLNSFYYSNVTANLLAAKGLVDVNASIGTAGATTQTVTLTTNTYNSAGAPFVGLVAADFDVIKTSDGTNITIVSVAETSDGVYLITTSGSTGLSAHIEVAKNGYDFSSLADLTFTYA